MLILPCTVMLPTHDASCVEKVRMTPVSDGSASTAMSSKPPGSKQAVNRLRDGPDLQNVTFLQCQRLG